jgi:serine/threonine protein kinase
VLNEFLDRRARGEAVKEADLLAEHPDIAEELRGYLGLLDDLEPTRQRVGKLVAQGLLSATADARYLAELGPYKITGLIGQGGMGIVLNALEESLNRAIASKVLRPDLACDRLALNRFTREAKAAAALRHPNIVTVYSVGEQNGTHYIAMERVDGPSLAEVIREHGPLPAETIRDIFRQLMVGLSAAHQAGLIHRDIKPSNLLLDGFPPPSQGGAGGCSTLLLSKEGPGEVLPSTGWPTSSEVGAPIRTPSVNEWSSPDATGGLSTSAGNGCPTLSEGGGLTNSRTPAPGGGRPPDKSAPSFRAARGRGRTSDTTERGATLPRSFLLKITDFGLARMLSSQTRITLPDSCLGTPEYMSPEQARGDENIDHRADLYSAGVVLYEMLTGRTPFKADAPSAVIHQILYTDRPTRRQFAGTPTGSFQRCR